MTACTKDKAPHFETHPGLKAIVESQWATLPERFPTVMTDAFVVMPNHVHGILVLRHGNASVGATLEVALRAGSSPAPTIGRIVGAFKSVCVNLCAKHLARENTPLKESFWQRNFYEHVIRNEEELNLIREYIVFNPLKWSLDFENPDHTDDPQYAKKWDWLECRAMKWQRRGDPRGRPWAGSSPAPTDGPMAEGCAPGND